MNNFAQFKMEEREFYISEKENNGRAAKGNIRPSSEIFSCKMAIYEACSRHYIYSSTFFWYYSTYIYFYIHMFSFL